MKPLSENSMKLLELAFHVQRMESKCNADARNLPRVSIKTHRELSDHGLIFLNGKLTKAGEKLVISKLFSEVEKEEMDNTPEIVVHKKRRKNTP